jgi:hypothetical protein
MPRKPLRTEDEKARFRWSPEMKERSGITNQLVTPTDIGEKQALKLIDQKLDDRHFTLLLNETGMVETQDPDSGFVHGPLCILLKNRLSKSFLDKVRPIIRKAARQSVAGGNRGDAAGTGMVPRKRKDGSVSKIKGVPKLNDLGDEDYRRLAPAKDGTVGFNARDMRGGQVYPCRLTMYSGALPSELRLMAELAQLVGEAFRRSWVCNLWEAQFEKASQTPPAFLIKTRDGHTPFTTITCNKNYRTAAHVDKGDLKAGFGALCCLGNFEGCDLVFPRYKTAVRYREGDILLANVHEVHGNTPLLNPDGTVPEPGREPERLVCVFYYEENMDQCLSTHEEEMEFVNNRKKGDPIYPKKKKKS